MLSITVKLGNDALGIESIFLRVPQQSTVYNCSNRAIILDHLIIERGNCTQKRVGLFGWDRISVAINRCPEAFQCNFGHDESACVIDHRAVSDRSTHRFRDTGLSRVRSGSRKSLHPCFKIFDAHMCFPDLGERSEELRTIDRVRTIRTDPPGSKIRALPLLCQTTDRKFGMWCPASEIIDCPSQGCGWISNHIPCSCVGTQSNTEIILSGGTES